MFVLIHISTIKCLRQSLLLTVYCLNANIEKGEELRGHMDIGEKITLIRKSENKTQELFANDIGISRSNLTNIENGRVYPTELLLNYLCLRYNVSKQWLQDDKSLKPIQRNLDKQDLARLISNFKQLDNDYQTCLTEMSQTLLSIQKER